MLPLNSHWWKGIPALPTAESDAIVIAKVLDAKAYLSSNRTAVYSEYLTFLEEVLKNTNGPAINVGDTIAVERLGGSVRFPSGKIQDYRISKQSLPSNDREYTLFLKYNGNGYDIITGYLIKNGRISPLDGDGDLQFGKYEGRTFESFLGELRNAIS